MKFNFEITFKNETYNFIVEANSTIEAVKELKKSVNKYEWPLSEVEIVKFNQI